MSRKKNVASGNDVVAMQVGQVTGRRPDESPEPDPAPTGGTTNICTGNARVGMQAGDVVIGDLRLHL